VDTSKNFSWLVLNTIAKLVGGHVQFISDEQAIIKKDGKEIAKFLGMTTVEVEGKLLNNALMHSATQIVTFIRGEQ